MSHKKQNLLRFGEKIDIHYILPKVSDNTENIELIQNYPIRLFSKRLQVFKYKGTICKFCNLEAQYFVIEQHKKNNINFHINLYGVDLTGDEVLFTKDHIIPKTKGGSEDLKNFQTLCLPCNQKKGKRYPYFPKN